MNFFQAGVGRAGLLLFLLFGIQAAAISQAVDHRLDPRQLYGKMRLATMLYSYSGSMTYEHDGQLSSFALSSLTDNELWTQNISALNGPERSFSQQLNPCEFGSLAQLQTKIADDTERMTLYYNFQARGDFRIAGRNAQEILVMPVDQFRYGYNFAVDTETGLMLQSMTMDSTRKILERFQFIEVDEAPSPEAFQTLVESCSETQPESIEQDDVPWSLAWVPLGFEQVVSRYRDGRVELVYSDGLATVSIFIVPVEQVRFPPVNSSTGATSMMLAHYGVQGETFRVTLVGEVPLSTLERIASQLHFEESGNAG